MSTELGTSDQIKKQCQTCRNVLPTNAFRKRRDSGERMLNCERCLGDAGRAWKSQKGACTICRGPLLTDGDDFAAAEAIVPDAAIFLTRGELVHSGCLPVWNYRRYCQIRGSSMAQEVRNA